MIDIIGLIKKFVERLCKGGIPPQGGKAISLNGTNLCVMDGFTSLAMNDLFSQPHPFAIINVPFRNFEG